ncbi:hypothetical protein [Rubrivirga sp.]|uniref:hypothetical protein n=1 Tax=Rubrivirga sp. TaxID=1885344 RepID=UPI003B520150
MTRLLLALLALAGCGGGPVDVQTADAVPLRLDRDDPDKLLGSVLGAYVGPDGGDPVEAGLLSRDGDAYVLHPQRLPPAARAALADANGDGAIDWDELAAMLEASYSDAVDLPATTAGLPNEDSPRFTVEVDGVMTAARRRISVSEPALRQAMTAFAETGTMEYPAGTWIVGEHLVDGVVVETTAKVRRADGFWDFAVYGPDGALAPATRTEPRALRVPTQCTGCHLGRRLFEPEKSFPAPATDGPFGPRAVHVPPAWRSPEATALFDEHARRDDGVLGLYATLYAGRLLDARQRGTISPDDAALLDALGL